MGVGKGGRYKPQVLRKGSWVYTLFARHGDHKARKLGISERIFVGIFPLKVEANWYTRSTRWRVSNSHFDLPVKHHLWSTNNVMSLHSSRYEFCVESLLSIKSSE